MSSYSILKRHCVARLGLCGNLQEIQCLGSGFQVRGAADAAYTGSNDQSIQNCPSYEQIFEPPIHGPGTPGFGYHTIFDFNKDFQISFDTVEGIDMYFFIAHLITFNVTFV